MNYITNTAKILYYLKKNGNAKLIRPAVVDLNLNNVWEFRFAKDGTLLAGYCQYLFDKPYFTEDTHDESAKFVKRIILDPFSNVHLSPYSKHDVSILIYSDFMDSIIKSREIENMDLDTTPTMEDLWVIISSMLNLSEFEEKMLCDPECSFRSSIFSEKEIYDSYFRPKFNEETFIKEIDDKISQIKDDNLIYEGVQMSLFPNNKSSKRLTKRKKRKN